MSEERGNGEGAGTQALSLLSYTLRYINLEKRHSSPRTQGRKRSHNSKRFEGPVLKLGAVLAMAERIEMNESWMEFGRKIVGPPFVDPKSLATMSNATGVGG
jgi:hypothetical protein